MNAYDPFIKQNLYVTMLRVHIIIYYTYLFNKLIPLDSAHMLLLINNNFFFQKNPRSLHLQITLDD